MNPQPKTSSNDPLSEAHTIMTANDPNRLLGSLNQLGSGRIIAKNGPLSLAIMADFRPIHPRGLDLIFTGGLLELTPHAFKVVVSTAACGLGLAVSLFDARENLKLVFHFCHGSDWKAWLENQVQSGLLQPHPKPTPVLQNLCWCELWPDPQAAVMLKPASDLENRFQMLTESRTIESTLQIRGLELTAVVHPASFDRLATSIRFSDRPRTRVCYADLSSLRLSDHGSWIGVQHHDLG